MTKRYFTFNKSKFLMRASFLIALMFFLTPFFNSNIFADIEHNGSSSYEDTDQDWNGDGVLDGVDKNGGVVGDKLLTWSVAAGIHIVGTFDVEKGYTLTIEPGAIIKFGFSAESNISVHGTLIADGSVNNKIVFTSINDDSYGGDTNNDGNTTSPAPGSWGSINFLENSVNCILDNTVILYAAGSYWHWGNLYNINQAVLINNSNPIISNNIIQHGNHHGIYLANSSAEITGNTISDFAWSGISNEKVEANISDNTITDCGGSAIAMEDYSDKSYTVLPSFSNNTFSNNGINGISFQTGTIKQNLTLEAIKNPYVFNNMTIDSGIVLTIKPGVIVKFNIHGWWEASALYVHGTLIADGTPEGKIVFTSINDDTYGGDTNNDKDSTVGAVYDWGSIVFYEDSKNSILDNNIIQYAGTEHWGYYYSHYAIFIGQSNPTISNNIIKHGGYDGIYLANSSAEITGNTISDFAWSGISMSDTSAPIINYNTISSNYEGIHTTGYSNPSVNNNNIIENINYGLNNVDASIMVNAVNNWWGDASGPNDPTDGNPDYNPNGTGDKVSDYINYRPWLEQIITSVDNEGSDVNNLPRKYSLSQNYPNPFNPSTTINYSLPKAGHVTLRVFDILGRKVAELVNSKQNAGNYSVQFSAAGEASNLSSGIYLYKLETGNFMSVKKMIVLK